MFATRGPSEILADKQVDAQLGYTFPETSRLLPNFGILLQVNNLTELAVSNPHWSGQRWPADGQRPDLHRNLREVRPRNICSASTTASNEVSIA